MRVKRYDDDDLQRFGGIISENIIDCFKLGFEAIDHIRLQVDKIPDIEADLATMKADISVIKRALKDTNVDVKDHDKRITKLENTVFHA